MNQRQRKYD